MTAPLNGRRNSGHFHAGVNPNSVIMSFDYSAAFAGVVVYSK